MITLTRAARPMGSWVGTPMQASLLRLVAPVGRASLVPVRGQIMEETLQRELVRDFIARLSDANLLLIMSVCVDELRERHTEQG